MTGRTASPPNCAAERQRRHAIQFPKLRHFTAHQSARPFQHRQCVSSLIDASSFVYVEFFAFACLCFASCHYLCPCFVWVVMIHLWTSASYFLFFLRPSSPLRAPTRVGGGSFWSWCLPCHPFCCFLRGKARLLRKPRKGAASPPTTINNSNGFWKFFLIAANDRTRVYVSMLFLMFT